MEKHQLDWISIEGFKSIANSGKIELRPINLVIGANGTGKSNFLNVFDFIRASSTPERLFAYVQENAGADELLFLGAKHTNTIRIHYHKENEITYSASYKSVQNDNLIRESFNLNGKLGKQSNFYYDKYLNGAYHIKDLSIFSPLFRNNNIDDNDYLRSDGSNLISFLYRLQLRFPHEYILIINTVRRIAPFFNDFLLRPNSFNLETIKLAWTQKGTDKYFRASSLSDGTLRFIFLTVLLLQPVELRPSVILIDEPELGLHPEAIGLLASLIKLASVDTQIIAATQSPSLLDHFAPEDVLVAGRVNGGTVFNRLDSNRLQVWLEDYSLGQLWEKNEIGGNPLPENSK
jgi:predicted ATPase